MERQTEKKREKKNENLRNGEKIKVKTINVGKKKGK
jgi:hypothetical protein